MKMKMNAIITKELISNFLVERFTLTYPKKVDVKKGQEIFIIQERIKTRLNKFRIDKNICPNEFKSLVATYKTKKKSSKNRKIAFDVENQILEYIQTRINILELYDILRQAHLSLKWWDSLLWYIFSGKLVYPKWAYSKYLVQDSFQQRRLFIEVFGDSTLNDVKEAFRWCSHFSQKHLQGRSEKGKRKKPKFNRDKAISVAFKHGKKEKTIYDKLPVDEIINQEAVRQAGNRFNKRLT